MSMLSQLASLGWHWIAVPLAALAFGVLLFLTGIGHLFRRRLGRASAHLVVGAPLALAGTVASFFGLNIQSYSRLTYEAPVATVRVQLVDQANSLYDVTVTRADANVPPQVCRLQGDEWDISARVQKWQPWANVLGLDTTYTLDQLTNRYATAERGNGKPITACDIAGPPPAINAYVPKSWLFWLFDHAFVEQRRFGSASFMPLAGGAEYRVMMTQSGLNAEPANDAAKKANGANAH